MTPLIDFLIYLIAFSLGAGLTWFVVAAFVPDRTAAAARDRLTSTEVGGE